ncbi:glycosyltransferase family 1 protein [Microcoleus sp. PH2017_30_WIL_O_A]|uniref:glycosyltransferase family 1 protein n=1 Tax=Microcoleus sp. PH2017_30_WIL_O_A TaxID=2798840 RepID=UPI001DE83B9A|nr:glycosyltransferase family 1 protein [Microcoleus sp. PH2017_30_WIL_O_A]MCC3587171.1 glycosyltransferase family 1 protein [Microcoleus sp. PH2017_30_WIL_O_A]
MLHFLWCGYNLSENAYEKYEFANLEIAKWAEYYLGKKVAFHQSNWYAGKVTDRPQDILLGHPTWDSRSQAEGSKMGKLLRDWVKDNSLESADSCHPNTYILMPWVPEFPLEWTSRMPYFERQLMAARKIFTLGGKIWIDRTSGKKDDSIQFLVKDKLVSSNMGVASQNFPIVKQSFNTIGERQLLHISNLAAYKGFDITCKSVDGLNTLLHVVSHSLDAPIGLVQFELDGQNYIFNFVGAIDNNDVEFNQWVVETCDFYIHTGRMDAQATTILENCARGLIPLVTPESGFSSPHAIYLTHDPDENRKIIESALNIPEAELLQRSHLLREQIQKEHSWDRIFGTIWDGIMSDIDSRSNSASRA